MNRTELIGLILIAVMFFVTVLGAFKTLDQWTYIEYAEEKVEITALFPSIDCRVQFANSTYNNYIFFPISDYHTDYAVGTWLHVTWVRNGPDQGWWIHEWELLEASYE